jgi:hypothetical protein
MIILHRSAAAAVAAVLLGGTPATAGKPAVMPQASETVTPTASGEKQFQVTAEGVCTGNNCLVTFGRKSGKERRATNLSCLLTSEGEGLGGIISVNARQISYLPVSSRASFGNAGEFAMAALSIEFVVRSGEELQVSLFAGKPLSYAACTVHGTIE